MGGTSPAYQIVSGLLGFSMLVCVVYGTISVGKRMEPPGTWRSAYGWCLVVNPVIGLLISLFHLLRRDTLGARKCLKYALLALPFLLICPYTLVIGALSLVKPLEREQGWRSVYGWSLFVPVIGPVAWVVLVLKRQSAQAWRSLMYAALGSCVWGSLVWVGSEQSKADAVARQKDIEETVNVVRTQYAGLPYETLEAMDSYRTLTTEERTKIHQAWLSVQSDHYVGIITKDVPGLSLDETRAAFRYSALKPSQQAQVDAAWAKVNRTHSKPPGYVSYR